MFFDPDSWTLCKFMLVPYSGLITLYAAGCGRPPPSHSRKLSWYFADAVLTARVKGMFIDLPARREKQGASQHSPPPVVVAVSPCSAPAAAAAVAAAAPAPAAAAALRCRPRGDPTWCECGAWWSVSCW